jgi:DNA-binding winged helix-turn-helix (wHTH) protein
MADRVTFGVFEFDPDSGILFRNGRPVRLPRQPARMLAALVAHPGEIVDRATLQAAIWGSETNVDFERGLNFCVAQIRTALGDSAASPRFVETFPKRGYRFIAPVQSAMERASDSGLRATGSGLQATGSGRRATDYGLPASGCGLPSVASRPRATALALAAVLAAAAVVGWTVHGSRDRGEPPRIVVVPFDNETGSPTSIVCQRICLTRRSPNSRRRSGCFECG